MTTFPNFTKTIESLTERMKHQGVEVKNAKWQSMPVKHDMQTYELLDVYFKVPLAVEDLQVYREDIAPNLPWVDNHFEERVCGEPINPGVEWANWPYGKSAERFLINGKFNHNYMERYWPRQAGMVEAPTRTAEEYEDAWKPDFNNTGIRGVQYGDLNDIVLHLQKDPNSRQAYLPIFFPEDTGVVHGGRVPCTLGYQFIHRHGHLHIVYYLRSCDFVRHFRDDIYLTVRLLLWVLDRLRASDPSWKDVKPGFYTMHMTSLHIFKADFVPLFGERKTW